MASKTNESKQPPNKPSASLALIDGKSPMTQTKEFYLTQKAPLGIQLVNVTKKVSVLSNKDGHCAMFVTGRYPYAQRLLSLIMDHASQLKKTEAEANTKERQAKKTYKVAAAVADTAAISPSQIESNKLLSGKNQGQSATAVASQDNAFDESTEEADYEDTEDEQSDSSSGKNNSQTSTTKFTFMRIPERRSFDEVLREEVKRLCHQFGIAEVVPQQRELNTIWKIMKGFKSNGVHNKELDQVGKFYAAIRVGAIPMYCDELHAACRAVLEYYKNDDKSSYENPRCNAWVLPVVLMLNEHLDSLDMSPINFTENRDQDLELKRTVRKTNCKSIWIRPTNRTGKKRSRKTQILIESDETIFTELKNYAEKLEVDVTEVTFPGRQVPTNPDQHNAGQDFDHFPWPSLSS